MRKGGGKAKGGGYEHTIIRKLAAAFKPLGIHEDDCYRTKNSGATKAQPGDIQFSPKFAKMFPVLIECKHYKTVKYLLGKDLFHQPKSYALRQWWQQVVREQKERKDKKAILVFRQNNCPDLVCLKFEHYTDLITASGQWSWFMYVYWKKDLLVMLPFDFFLESVVSKIKATRIIKKRAKK